MKILFFLLMSLIPAMGYGEVTCKISNYSIEVGDSGYVVVEGKLNGEFVRRIDICGGYCRTKATDRNLQLALTAMSADITLQAVFEDLDKCSDVEDDAQANTLIIKN